MADRAKIGTDWQADELDAIVADYFAMLDADLSGRKYIKLVHSTALMAQIGRTHRSVEFKHQNISAVLEKLGMPWILGYKPKRNYQTAIFGAIDRYLTKLPDILERVPPAPLQTSSPVEIFVSTPPLAAAQERMPERLRQLVQKFDPVERDRRNRFLGKAGEEFVVHLERRRLAGSGRPDLAERIRWVAADGGDGAGYDVLSFDAEGHERLLEVKTTNGSSRTPFFLTRNELAVSAQRAADWCIYRVHLFSTQPRIFTIAPPLKQAVNLAPETWRALFSSQP